MPDPSGLKISQLPKTYLGLRPYDSIVAVQSGDSLVTYKVPGSSILQYTTNDVPEGSSNLYYSFLRSTSSFSTDSGLLLTAGLLSISKNNFDKITSTYQINSAAIEGDNEKILTINTTAFKTYSTSWTDIGKTYVYIGDSGISVSRDDYIYTIKNQDRGSDQSVFKNIYINNDIALSASDNNDRINFKSGNNILIETGVNNLTINSTITGNLISTINAVSGITSYKSGYYDIVYSSDKGSDELIFKNISVETSTGVVIIPATGNNSSLVISSGTNIILGTGVGNTDFNIGVNGGTSLISNVMSINGFTGVITLDTDDIIVASGNTNNYLNASIYNHISAGSGISVNNGRIDNSRYYSNYFNNVYSLDNGLTVLSPNGEDTLKFNSSNLYLETYKSDGSDFYDTIKINRSSNKFFAAFDSTTTIYPYLYSLDSMAMGHFLFYPPIAYSGNTVLPYRTSSITNKLSITGTLHVNTYGSSYYNSCALQEWRADNRVSRITPSGSFEGSVTPKISGYDRSIVLNNSDNGNIVELFASSAETGVVVYLSSGITIPGWNVKIRQGDLSRVYVRTQDYTPLMFPNDRMPSTRTNGSVINVYKNSLGFVVYGDMPSGVFYEWNAIPPTTVLDSGVQFYPDPYSGNLNTTNQNTVGSDDTTSYNSYQYPCKKPNNEPTSVCDLEPEIVSIVPLISAAQGISPFEVTDPWVYTSVVRETGCMTPTFYSLPYAGPGDSDPLEDYIFSSARFRENLDYPIVNNGGLYIDRGSCVVQIDIPYPTGCYNSGVSIYSPTIGNVKLNGLPPWNIAINPGGYYTGIFSQAGLDAIDNYISTGDISYRFAYGETYLNIYWNDTGRTYIIPSYRYFKGNSANEDQSFPGSNAFVPPGINE